MQLALLIVGVLFFLGMASAPPAPVCKNEPIVNAQVEQAINAQCSDDCTKRKVSDPNCISDCTSFSKWGIKYGNDK